MTRRVLWGSLVTIAIAACTGGSGGMDSGNADADAAPADTTPPPSMLTLAPGEAAEITLTSGAANVQLATPDGTEKFVLVLGSMDLTGSGNQLTYQVGNTAASTTSSASVLHGCSITPDAWRMRTLPMDTVPTGTAPAVGTTRMFDMQVGSNVVRISTHVVTTTAHTVVWADDTPAHPAQLDPTFVSQFINDFEQTILPREHEIFGVESDIDADGHIQLVFSPLTYQSAVAYFSQCDLGATGCRVSNHGEMIYLTPPNTIPPPYNTPAAMKEILAHEFSHLIHFGQKALRNHMTAWHDAAYMIEGYGALAQDVIGFQAGNFYVWMAGLAGIDDFTMPDILINDSVYDTTRDGTLRGNAYLFVRWMYDRAGGDTAMADGTIANAGGPALIRTLEDSPMTIADDLPIETGSTLEEMSMDFFTTLAMSNRSEVGDAAPVNACFEYLPVAMDPVTHSVRGADMYQMFHGMMMMGPAIQPVAMADGTLLAGGVELLEVDATAGQTQLPVSVTVDPSALPRLRIARVH